MSESFQIWDHFLPLLFPKDSENLKSLDIGLREVGAKRRLNGVNKWKKSVKNFFRRGDFTPFMSKSFQIWDHFFPLLFPKDSENLKSLDIGLWEVGAKRRLNGVNKWKKICKKLFSPRWFHTLYELKFSILWPLLSITFPQGFQKSKKFGHWTSRSGGKKTFK